MKPLKMSPELHSNTMTCPSACMHMQNKLYLIKKTTELFLKTCTLNDYKISDLLYPQVLGIKVWVTMPSCGLGFLIKWVEIKDTEGAGGAYK